MIRARALRAREKLLSKLPVTGELLRGSLVERTIRHTKDCPKCARIAALWQSSQAHRSAPAILRPADPVGHSDGLRFASRHWSKFNETINFAPGSS